jgi:hypothetical protein
MWQVLRNERQNGAGYFDSLISRVVSPSMSVWLSLRSIKNVVARATCRLASSLDSLWLSGHEFPHKCCLARLRRSGARGPRDRFT